MRTPTLWSLFALAVATMPAAAGAGTPTTEKMTCPIGGKSFDFATTASYTVMGTRADGKPFGSWTFPLALPECPDNGLILYKDYSAEEVAKLEPLVASEAYQALRGPASQYYRAYWLMREMGLPAESYLWALLQASWEADAQPELRARYQAELVEASAKVAPDPASLNWIGMEGRAANALRELGRFDEALARLDAVPATALAPAAGASGDDAKARQGWADYYRDLRVVIARKDRGAEPLDMLPRQIALGRCVTGEGLDPQQNAWCASEETAVAAVRAKRDALRSELETIGKAKDGR